MSPKNTDQEEENSKIDDIMKAAQQRFGQYGLCKTTMMEIATDIGLSKAALYYYYPDKESLFEAVVLKEQKQFLEELTSAIKPGTKASTLLLTYVKKRQDYFDRFMNLGKLRYESMSTSKPLLCRLSENLLLKEQQLVRTILEIGVANKEFKKMNTQDQAVFLITMLQGFRLYAVKMQNDLVMSEEEHAALDENLKKAIQLFIRDISL
ncbi:MAG TPA: TetR/AcrR family transcriptional regulator [Cytophagaceae bacterium]|jgi:TetR/AcrR family transcriptional repressor of mexJK operon|nr:TetR/AcrR family transcriptional regulator [Cytophagaceae bacterium]